MKIIFKSLVVSAMFILSSTAYAAGDVAAGKEKGTNLCAACHGEQGMGKNDIWPNLAGQKEAYIAKQLHDFKGGSRPNQVMTPVALILSDKDIADLAAYYSSLK